jgi:hypothetical protein
MTSIFAQEQSIDKLVSHAMAEIGEFLKECEQREKRLDEVEEGLFRRLMNMGGSLLQAYVDRSGNGDRGATYEHEGKVLKRSREEHSRPYRSIFGVLQIRRYVYAQREGQRIEAAFVDQELGLPAGEQSYVLENWLNRLTTHVSYDTAVNWLAETLEIHTTVRAAEMMARKGASSVEGFREQRSAPPAKGEAEIVVVTADGKGVPMRRPLEQRLKDELGKPLPKRRLRTTYEKANKRAHRGEKKVRKQMAYVGSVYTIAPWERFARDILDEVHRKATAENRPDPQNKRLWAEMTQILEGRVDRGMERLFGQLEGDAALRDRRRAKTWVVLLDGDRALWEAKKKHLPEAVGILDLYHVLEYLWKASYCFHPESSQEAESFVTRYLQMLLEGQVGNVIGVFRRFLKRQKSRRGKTTGLKRAIDYFAANREAMRYDEYLEAGYPIGSGVVEGACRHVVKDRMECTGMRWEIEGAQNILDLRTTYLNGEWSAFTKYRIETEQAALYASSA